MNKVEQREIKTLTTMHNLGMTVNVALGLSALIRCAMTKKSKAALMEYATIFNVANHPDFII
jgi:hypothetical protein